MKSFPAVHCNKACEGESVLSLSLIILCCNSCKEDKKSVSGCLIALLKVLEARAQACPRKPGWQTVGSEANDPSLFASHQHYLQASSSFILPDEACMGSLFSDARMAAVLASMVQSCIKVQR